MNLQEDPIYIISFTDALLCRYDLVCSAQRTSQSEITYIRFVSSADQVFRESLLFG